MRASFYRGVVGLTHQARAELKDTKELRGPRIRRWLKKSTTISFNRSRSFRSN